MELIELGYEIEYQEIKKTVRNDKTGEVEKNFNLSNFYIGA